MTDFYRSLRGLRERAPVAAVRTARGRRAWLVLGAEQVRAGLSDRRLSVQGGLPPDRAGRRRAMDIGLTRYDGETHDRLRALARGVLSAPAVEGYRQRLGELAAGLVARLPRGDVVELMAAFAHPFSFAAVVDLFGIRPEAREPLYDAFLEVFDRTGAPPEAALDLIEATIRQELAARHHRPGPDALSTLRDAWQADGTLGEDELVSLAASLLTAGFDSTAQSIAMAVVALLDRPALLRRMLSSPPEWPRIREELLRWDTPGPFSSPRHALADLELGGVTIPRGAQVIFAYAAANRDPAVFDRPDELDPGRADARRHLTFGRGPHACPGAALARAELTVALHALFGAAPAMRLAAPRGALRWPDDHRPRRLAALPVALGPAVTHS